MRGLRCRLRAGLLAGLRAGAAAARRQGKTLADLAVFAGLLGLALTHLRPADPSGGHARAASRDAAALGAHKNVRREDQPPP